MIRLIFKATVPQEEFDAFAEGRGWSLAAHRPEAPDQAEECVWDTGTGVAVHRVHDRTLALSFVAVAAAPDTGAEGAGEAEEEVGKVLTAEFPAYGREELAELYRGSASWSERVIVLPMVAVAAPASFDPPTFEVITTALRDPHRDVRLAGLFATYSVPWPEFTAPLQDLARNDPEESLREAAAEAMAHIAERPAVRPADGT